MVSRVSPVYVIYSWTQESFGLTKTDPQGNCISSGSFPFFSFFVIVNLDGYPRASISRGCKYTNQRRMDSERNGNHGKRGVFDAYIELFETGFLLGMRSHVVGIGVAVDDDLCGGGHG